MALMATTTGAVIFRARPDELVISFGGDMIVDGRPKARPAGTAVILLCGIKQWQVTTRTAVLTPRLVWSGLAEKAVMRIHKSRDEL